MSENQKAEDQILSSNCDKSYLKGKKIETRHTKGSWYWNGMTTLRNEKNYLVKTDLRYCLSSEKETTKANRELIAASPDMHDYIVEIFETLRDKEKLSTLEIAWRNKALEIITKINENN